MDAYRSARSTWWEVGGNGTEIRYSVSADNRIPGAARVLAGILLSALKRQLG